MRTMALVAMTAGLLLPACDEDGRKGEQSPTPASSPASRPTTDQRAEIREGQKVIVESGTATYWSGIVVKVGDPKVTYRYGTNDSTGEADRNRVYVVPPGHQTVARADDVAVCDAAPEGWVPCLVKRVDGGKYLVDDVHGNTRTLVSSKIIVPNEGARARLRAKLDEAFEHRDFVRAARAAGPPRLPEGWTPRPGDDVVAKFTDASWYGGRIRRLTPTKIHIAWDDKSSPSERNHDEVAPKPEKAQDVREGQYVLGRPRKGTRWDYHRVERVDDRGVVIVDKDGRKRKVRKSDVVPLGD